MSAQQAGVRLLRFEEDMHRTLGVAVHASRALPAARTFWALATPEVG
ncbi:hypothetical protein [Deinococcus pimensis]|nr:hypothetical protein [Deinococcus pimensis]